MNNSRITIENIVDERVVSEEARTIRIIEAIQGVRGTKEWRTLKEEIFDGLTTSLEKELKSEARSENLSAPKLYRLAGKLEWAERFSNLEKLENSYKIQLQNLRKQYGEKE